MGSDNPARTVPPIKRSGVTRNGARILSHRCRFSSGQRVPNSPESADERTPGCQNPHLMRNRYLIPSSTLLIGASTLILLITMGSRQSTGLFVQPVIASTGLGIASVSFALAIGQFIWGAVQPVFGALADKVGAHRIVIAGSLLLAMGAALTPFMTSELGLLLTFGLMMAAGAGAGSFSILIGATARGISPERRSSAAGFVNAGGSLGQFLFAPLMQFVIAAWSWAAGMYVMAAIVLLTVPLALLLRERVPSSGAAATAPAVTDMGLKEQVRRAMRDPSYLFLHAGFFTCGFHVAFLVTHLPGELQLCGLSAGVAANSLALIGLFNVGGSLAAGWLGQRYRMKYLLAWIYGSRAVLIAIYLLMPKSATNVYLFAAGLGLTWLATVPPTSGIVGKLFGVRYLGTLFGLTLLSHQIGGFLGAWVGGLAMARLGSYDWVWYADMGLATAAALINLPIRESRLVLARA